MLYNLIGEIAVVLILPLRHAIRILCAYVLLLCAPPSIAGIKEVVVVRARGLPAQRQVE